MTPAEVIVWRDGIPDGVLRGYRYEVKELGKSPSTGVRSHRRSALLSELLSMMRSHPSPGPLMSACIKDAEHHARGGHRHRRRA